MSKKRTAAQTRRLTEMIDILRATPRKKYHQGDWCGTACCMAGHALFHFGTKKERDYMTRGFNFQLKIGEGHDVPERARELLGLSQDEANALFASDDYWPAKYKTKKDNIWELSHVTPKRAAYRIIE